MESYANVGILQ